MSEQVLGPRQETFGPEDRPVPLLGLATAIETRDASSNGSILNNVLQLTNCDRSEARSGFANATNLVRIGEVQIIATCGHGVVADADPIDSSCFMIPFATYGEYRAEGKLLHNYYLQNILHMPAVNWSLEIKSSLIAGVCVVVSPLLMLDKAASMAGGTGRISYGLRSFLERPALLDVAEGYGLSILDMLLKYFAFLESVVISFGTVPEMLCLDDLLLRQLLLLIDNSLLGADDFLLADDSPGFAELLDWMQAQCHAPLCLSDLEARSGYSRRNLQRIFKLRFGCGPMQWLRKQRLLLARQKLEFAPLTTGVQKVALECGYIDIRAFSRDYRKAFSVSPRTHLHRHSKSN
jgi:AraC-like DNA-binding protein